MNAATPSSEPFSFTSTTYLPPTAPERTASRHHGRSSRPNSLHRRSNAVSLGSVRAISFTTPPSSPRLVNVERKVDADAPQSPRSAKVRFDLTPASVESPPSPRATKRPSILRPPMMRSLSSESTTTISTCPPLTEASMPVKERESPVGESAPAEQDSTEREEDEDDSDSESWHCIGEEPIQWPQPREMLSDKERRRACAMWVFETPIQFDDEETENLASVLRSPMFAL